MKVLNISSSSFGGAGIAAQRIHLALNRSGFSSTFLSRDSFQTDLKQISPVNFTKLQEFESSFLTLMQAVFFQRTEELMTPLSVDLLSKTKNIEHFFLQFDIINIHSTYNIINNKTLQIIKSLGIPIIITMHDERSITGGCHYTTACANFQRKCEKCPKINWGLKLFPKLELRSKNDLMNNIKPFVIVPSKWLKGQIQKSGRSYDNIKVLANPINQTFLDSLDKLENAKYAKIRVGFISQNLNNPYKGYADFEQALLALPVEKRNELEVILVGKGEATSSIGELIPIRETFSSESGLIEIYSKLDYLVVPSRVDNFPNVMVEALVSGVKVIGSNVGGIREVCKIFDQHLFESGNYEELKEILLTIEKVTLSEKTALKLRTRHFFSDIEYGHSFKKVLQEWNISQNAI